MRGLELEMTIFGLRDRVRLVIEAMWLATDHVSSRMEGRVRQGWGRGTILVKESVTALPTNLGKPHCLCGQPWDSPAINMFA